MRKIIVVALAALTLCGCGTIHSMMPKGPDTRPIGPNGERLNRLPGTPGIEISPGITDAQALDAVEQVASQDDNDHRRAFTSQWRVEARDHGNKWIRIGLTARGHYLQVCFRIENGRLMPDVPYSENLGQDGTYIHRKVPGWINSLTPLVIQRMYRIQHPEKKQK